MRTVAVAVIDGIQLLDIAAPTEVFGVNRSDLVDPWYRFVVCGEPTACVGGWFHPHAPRSWNELPTADTVIIPAVRNVDEAPPAELIEAVRAAHEQNARVVSIYTGAFVLAAAGLLDGRRATTHWLHAKRLATTYPKVNVVTTALHVDEGSVVTSAGKTAGIDLCVNIVRSDYDDTVADALADQLVLLPNRSHSPMVQPRATSLDDPDDALSRLLPWVTENLNQALTVTDLARQANMSTRSLTRRFNALTGITPLQWLLSQRINRAQELLETTNNSVEQVADQTGMGTAATLRRHFNRTVGVSPDAYRRTMRSGQHRRVSGLAG